jgi:large subunit ribosomal protein L25
MKSIELKAHKRTAEGKKDLKVLRSEGNIPCILYGGDENVLFYSHEIDVKKIVYTPSVYIIKLNIEGKTYDAIIKDLQFHPVTDKVLHIDFLQVVEGKPVVMKVPVNLEGDSEGVKQGGKLHLSRRSLKVRGMADDLPDKLTIDISGLELGKVMKVRDLSFDNIELLDQPSDVVCSVKLTRTSRAGAEGLTEEELEAKEAEEAEATAAEESKEEAAE